MTERLSASNAAKHLACHASANLPLAIPGWQPPDVQETAASTRGTNMHEVLEKSGEYTPAQQLALAKAMMYVAELRATRRFTQYLEAGTQGWWLKSTPNTRADIVLAVADELHVIDLKFGKIPVAADGNAQGKYYSLAYLPLAKKAKGVTFHIVQPLIDNMDSTWFSRAELEQFMRETQAAEAAIAAGDTTFGPSDHCMFCPANPHSRGVKAKPYCPAMMRMLYPNTALDIDDVLR